MNKVFQSGIFRALCAIIVGALLVKYREETVTWLTIAIGVIFLLSGLISCMAYFSSRRAKDEPKVFDAQGNAISRPTPTFPIVGIGSVVLGVILALTPATFINGLVYILAAILILGALNQFFNLASATRYAHIGFFWWILPAAVLLVGCIAIIKPSAIATAPLFIIGWSMMVYGVVDLINAIKVFQCRKAYDKLHAITETEVVEEEAVKEEAPKVIEGSEQPKPEP
jgi:uncharacterized membrane protein HdeD (DUF308 family)